MTASSHLEGIEGSAARRVAERRARALWGLTTLVAVAGGLLALVLADAGAPGRQTLPWWALLLLFGVTECCVVHVHFRRSAHSLTLGEIPLVLGLLFAPPLEVMAAWAIATAFVLIAMRAPLARIAFNVALMPLATGTAALVMSGLSHAPAGSGLEPGVWGAAAAGAIVSTAVGAVLIGLAVGISEGRPDSARLAYMLGMSAVVATTNTCLALAIAVVAEADARATALLLVPVATLFGAYRAYLRERARHESLEFLYEASRTLTDAADPATALAGLLARARTAFRGAVVEAVIFESPAGGAARTTLGPGDRVEILEPVPADVVAAMRELLHDRTSIPIRRSGAPPAITAHLAARHVNDGLIAAMRTERGIAGVLMVGDRAGVAGGAFTADELRLLETLAAQTGATLEQGRLGRQVAQLHELQRDLEHQAFHDPLTGLANRLLFHDRVRHALARRNGNAAVMYIDLDDFKPVNDTYGHDAGDALLVAVGQRLHSAVRASDTPARFGGDEFAILLLDITEENARRLADRILGLLAQPVDIGGRQVPVKASLGLVVGEPGAKDADELLRKADAAMYVAKHGGKNRVAMHSAALSEAA
jgi:diguanylate cyclase (GGDEF)-like protein